MNTSKLYNKIISSISKEIKKVINEGEALQSIEDDYEDIDYIFDLKDLIKSKNDLLKIALTSLQMNAEVAGYGGPYMIINDKFNKLYESATRTYPYEELIKHYRTKLGLEPGFIKAEIGSNNVQVITLFINNYNNLEFIKEAMEQFGWSYAFSKSCNLYGFNLMAVYFDPMFQDNVNDEVKQCSLLYHWTPKYHLEEIIKNGLIPKSENCLFSYPPKIHLLKGNIDEINKISIGKQLCIFNKNPKNTGEYILLNIDTVKIPYEINFFYDPRYEFGYYTKEHICKEVITVNKEYNFEI